MQIECWILVVGSAAVATALMVFASSVYRDLVREINAAKPLEPPIRGGDRTKLLNALGQHADMFPESRKRLLLTVLGISGIVGFLTFAISAVICFGSVA
jgi:hypothetical protein